MTSNNSPLVIAVDAAVSVSAIVQLPPNASACYVFAHGAGAGMNHQFMTDVADGLAARGIASLRFQFPYMEHGSGRPDRPALAHATVRAAVNAARAQFPGLPLFAGGKSFGGRMTSQAQAIEPLEGVKGLVFFGFPMHGAGKPAAGRADHLHKIGIPMLFIQGTRDKLAEIGEMQALVKELAQFASLKTIEEGDHSFHVPRRTGRSDHDVQSEFLDAMAKWLISLDPPSTPG